MDHYPKAGELVAVDEQDSGQCPVGVLWVPQWIVDCGKGCEVGITIDDRCFVVLAKNWVGQWVPTTHIPREAAEKIGELSLTSL